MQSHHYLFNTILILVNKPVPDLGQVTPKIDNKRPKSVQVNERAVEPHISISRAVDKEKPDEPMEESLSTYLVILQNLKPDGSSSSIMQEEDLRNDNVGESETFQDPPSDKNITPTGTLEQVKGQEIETYVTFPRMEDVQNPVICEFSESDDTRVTGGNETCIVGEQNCEHSTFFSDEEKTFTSTLLYGEQFSIADSETLGDDESTLETGKEIKCQKEEESAIEMERPFCNKTFFDKVNDVDALVNAVITDNASQKEENIIEKNCAVQSDSASDNITDESTDHESDDDKTDHESDASSKFEIDTSCYVNYPEDLRPSLRLPQRLTSRRSTSLFCTDWDLETDKRGHGGCWNWLSTRL